MFGIDAIEAQPIATAIRDDRYVAFGGMAPKGRHDIVSDIDVVEAAEILAVFTLRTGLRRLRIDACRRRRIERTDRGQVWRHDGLKHLPAQVIDNESRVLERAYHQASAGVPG